MSLSYILGDDKHTQNDKSIIDVLSNLLIGKKNDKFQGPMLWGDFNQTNSRLLTKEENVMSHAFIISVDFSFALWVI